MIEGQLIFDGFQFALGDARTITGETKKVIAFQPVGMKASFNFIFTEEELKKFIQVASGGNIVVAHEMPKDGLIKL